MSIQQYINDLKREGFDSDEVRDELLLLVDPAEAELMLNDNVLRMPYIRNIKN